MKENEIFSFMARRPVVLIALDSALVGFGPNAIKIVPICVLSMGCVPFGMIA
jgi:hypothetical protein